MHFKEQLTIVQREYKDIFAWSYGDMKGLNLESYHHKINLANEGCNSNAATAVSAEPELYNKGQRGN
jgi:hypothetical protein